MLLRIAFAAALASAVFAQDAALDHFEKKVRPVLAAQCYSCHSKSLATPQGGLLLDSAKGIRQGGNSGPVFVPGDPEQSLLIRALRHGKNLKMPPGKPLAPETVADFETWIKEGAALPADKATTPAATAQLWSLQKPKPTPGATIDNFIESRLRAKGISMSPEADKRTLIRRTYFDLTGLPPNAREIDAFIKDADPQAYEKLIDRLLASPRYGERWGRHWLDVARYADSVNNSVNMGTRYPWSYTYRDWVIQAFNDDLPYDRFVTYQLAADRIQGLDPKHLAALGFLSLGREFPNSYPETVDDRIDAVTRGFLGFTVACARCHDHKYDPIPTKDYYSLYSILANVRQPEKLPLLSDGGPSLRQQVYEERLARIRQDDRDYRVRRNAEMVAFFKTQIAGYLMAAHDAEGLSNPEVEELVRDRQLNLHMLRRWQKHLRASKASGEPVFRRWHEAPNAARKEIAAEYATLLNRHDRAEPYSDAAVEQMRAVMRGPASPADVPVEEFASIYTEGDSNNTRTMELRYNTMLAQAAYDGAAPRAMAIEDQPKPEPGFVFVRGNPNNHGAPVNPRFLSCLGASDDRAFTDRRLDLARSIADQGNPFTARVIVNRIWMHHFGAGLVRTPSDFGFRGDLPTHPELLDHLAADFVASGWSIKKLHRKIMTSAAYKQASADNEAARKIDPENLLLWRMNRRRLEIEALRDSALSAAGRLELTMGGVPFPLTAHDAVPRRSIYGFIERGRIPGVLSAFDFASPDQHAPMRYVTTVPQQALFFLNSPFIAEQARHLALRSRSSTPSARIRDLYRFTFGREPEPAELAAGLKFTSSPGASTPQIEQTSTWQYGSGEGSGFEPFKAFVPDQWQGSAVLPDPRSGKGLLRAAGGEPGETPDQAVVRRWTSPVKGRMSVEGVLRHNQPAVPYGDGVRGRIVSSRYGELASWSVSGSSAETKYNGIDVEKGDTIDFIVDARRDPENDAFNWAPIVKYKDQTWNAALDFAGPPTTPLDIWARYAQVLLQTNEFAFVD